MNVAFLIFNRPELTARVFARIAQARPSTLLVVADGPRHEGERQRCMDARAVIERVDWPCQVLRNYADVNMGCRRRVSSGLNWVFEQVEEAIILEDDCVPEPSFFPFCDELLNRYCADERIGHIGGCNLLPAVQAPYSYYFTLYPRIWGWATWRRAWRSYDVEMSQWPLVRDGNWMVKFFPTSEEAAYFSQSWENLHRGLVDTWDGQWFYAMRVKGYAAIVPTVNLVTNIGFDSDATHTNYPDWKYAKFPSSPMCFPLRHPPFVATDRIEDREYCRLIYSLERPLWQRVMWKLKNKHWYGQWLRRIPWIGRQWGTFRTRSRG